MTAISAISVPDLYRIAIKVFNTRELWYSPTENSYTYSYRYIVDKHVPDYATAFIVHQLCSWSNDTVEIAKALKIESDEVFDMEA